MNTLDVICAGEVMVEFCSTPINNSWQQSFGGDTFNTAIYLARAGLQVDYMTRLGDDHFSNNVIDLLRAEKIGTGFVERLKARRMGLYTIQNQSDGERSFDYWREHSPARELFDRPHQVPACQYFYFSGITLAVIAGSGLDNLVCLLQGLKECGTQVVFDPNYRPVLWKNLTQARQTYQTIFPYCDIVLPTFDDEQALWGVTNLQACRDFYIDFSFAELVIKAPDLSCHVVTADDYVVLPATPVQAVDTTGAGDSFNAGYLAARFQQKDICAAIKQAQQLAARVVQYRGAIMPLVGDQSADLTAAVDGP